MDKISSFLILFRCHTQRDKSLGWPAIKRIRGRDFLFQNSKLEIRIWSYFEVWLLLFKYEINEKLWDNFETLFSPRESVWPKFSYSKREWNIFFSKNSTSCMRWCLWKFECLRNCFVSHVPTHTSTWNQGIDVEDFGVLNTKAWS